MVKNKLSFIRSILKKFKEKPDIFYIIGLVILYLIIFISASHIKFWWIDDGWTVMTAQKILSAIKALDLHGLSIIFFEQGGRLRFVYWFYQAFVYLLARSNSVIFFIFHFLVIFFTSLYIYKIVKLISKSPMASFIAGMLYFLVPINTENIFRLGPQEPILALLICSSIYYLLKKKLSFSIILMFLATFTKESGFVLWIPILCIYILKRILNKERDKNLEKYIIWGIFFSVLVVANTFMRRGGYSSHYVFDLARLIYNFKHYFVSYIFSAYNLYLNFALLIFLHKIILFKKNGVKEYFKKGFFFDLILILFSVIYIAVQSPWEYLLSRYVMPATVMVSIFIGIQIADSRKLLIKSHKRLYYVTTILIIAYTIFFAISQTLGIFHEGERYAYETSYIQKLYSNLAKTQPKGGLVLFNFLKGESTEELVAESSIHLDLFYNRPDIKVEYLDINNLPKPPYTIVATSMIRKEYPTEVVLKNIKNYTKNNDVVEEKKSLIFTSPFRIVTQTAKKVYFAIIKHQPINADGIYTFYISKDQWDIYYVH